MLGCGHSFCYKCLLGLVNSAHAMQSKQKKGGRDANRCCPTCKRSFEGQDWRRQHHPHFVRVLAAYKRARGEAVKLAKLAAKARAAGLRLSSDDEEEEDGDSGSSSEGGSGEGTSGSSDDSDDEDDDGDDDDVEDGRESTGGSSSSSVIDVTDRGGKTRTAPAADRHDLQRPQFKSKEFTQAKLIRLMLDLGLRFAKDLSGEAGKLQHYYERYRIIHNVLLGAERAGGGARSDAAAMTERAYETLCRKAATRVIAEYTDFVNTNRHKKVKTSKEGVAALTELRKKGGDKFAKNQKKLENNIRRRLADEKRKTTASCVSTAVISSSSDAVSSLSSDVSPSLSSLSSSSSPYFTAAAAVRRSWKVTWSEHSKRWFYYHVASQTGQWHAPPAFREKKDTGVQTLPALKEEAAAAAAGKEGVAEAAAVAQVEEVAIEKAADGTSSGRAQRGSGALGQKRKRVASSGPSSAAKSASKKKKKEKKKKNGKEEKTPAKKVGKGKTESGGGAAGKEGAAGGQSKSSRTTMTSSFSNCPVCHKEMHVRLLQAHVNGCLDNDDR